MACQSNHQKKEIDNALIVKKPSPSNQQLQMQKEKILLHWSVERQVRHYQFSKYEWLHHGAKQINNSN